MSNQGNNTMNQEEDSIWSLSPIPTAQNWLLFPAAIDCLGYSASERIHSQQHSDLSPYLDSSQRLEHGANASCENRKVIIDAQPNYQNTSSTTSSAAGTIRLQDIEQQFGKKRKEAAESLRVSVSTFKRICRIHGICRWPSAKRKRGKCVLSAASKCNASGTSEGFNEDSNLNSMSITGHVADDMDYSARPGVQPFLESTSKHQLSSPASNKDAEQKAKILFDTLIRLPLKDLIDPENETSMTGTLSILADNLSLFPGDEQAKRIIELKFDFPTLVHSWREYSRSQMHNQKFFSELEVTRNLAETSVKEEESLKATYKELEQKEKELITQLKAVQKEKAWVAEQRHVKFKQTKHWVSLAEEKAGRTKDKHLEMTTVSAKLNNLVDQWARLQSSFI
ncbi:hypothetical protein HAX54_043532 [Datura stramonium]|uniref:RWP-RK domain-containing protein n=1 Tax=Datura stramonium TaxID=4076 RepID=A0ABS8SNA6_DATST|nr:hypothetical protein [Datura stramonium]